jgi:hypothetical protein
MSDRANTGLNVGWVGQASQTLVQAGEVLAARQALSGSAEGNVPPFSESHDLDFHGTLAAIWVWVRAQQLTERDDFAVNIAAGWRFVSGAWHLFVPTALGASASEEAPYDCAMVLRAATADRSVASTDICGQVQAAARLLSVYLSDLEDLSGREFQDPGFLVWSLSEWARQAGEQGLLGTARRFVERAFSMKTPPAFATEPTPADGLFDFSSTTAMRVLAVMAAEGDTPFAASWLRERVVAGVPGAFVARPRDENAWNACAALACGRAYRAASDPAFLHAHQTLLGELGRRAEGGVLGRQPGYTNETCPTFYYALAADSLVHA